MKILALIIVSFILGCAVTLTEEETATCKGNVTCLTEALDQKTYQAKYEAENRRILQREQLVASIQRCFDTNGVIMQMKRSGSKIGKPLRDKHGVIHLPKYAHFLDYKCATSGQARDTFERAGLF